MLDITKGFNIKGFNQNIFKNVFELLLDYHYFNIELNLFLLNSLKFIIIALRSYVQAICVTLNQNEYVLFVNINLQFIILKKLNFCNC